ncbi:MAG: beta-ketoacyl synthase N-terminal-like domain-containing protein [Nitrospinota bacterium]|nr:beta-ketoacyl synthase N-terminal-like domain-containing protein [Nitrospinota bacterium]
MPAALAVTGGGIVTAAGRGLDAAWEALRAGRSFLAPDDELAGFSSIETARCAPPGPEMLGADRRAARLMGRHTHMLLAAVSDALAEAGGNAAGLAGEEMAFFAGMDSVDPGEADFVSAVQASRVEGGGVDLGRFFNEGMTQIPPLWPLGMLNSTAFCQVAIQFGLRGENGLFSPGAEAAAQAVIEAAESLREGKARAALAAGVSPTVSVRSVARYRKRGLLKPDAAPDGGPALGEGAASLLLEPEGVAGGKPRLGYIRGWGRATAGDEPGDLAGAVRDSAAAALQRAEIGPGRVGLVVVHGGGSVEEGEAEAEGIAAVLGGHRPLALATKGAFGHLLGGGPAVDLLIALRAMAEGAVPPSPGVGNLGGDVLEFPDRPKAARLEAGLVLVQGFDGACAAFAVGPA